MGKRIVGAILTLAFTALSMVAGWEFYRVILTEAFAWGLVGTFEAGRLTSLYYMIWQGKKKVIPFYCLVAVACAGAGIAYFVTEMQTQKNAEMLRYVKNITSIKRAALTERDALTEQKRTEKHGLQFHLEKLAYYKSKSNNDKVAYHQERINQIKTEIKKIESVHNVVIGETPKNPKNWISQYAAEYGLDIATKDVRFSAMEQALTELTGLRFPVIKLIYGIAFISVIELLILMFAFLSYANGTERKNVTEAERTNVEPNVTNDVNVTEHERTANRRRTTRMLPGKPEEFKWWCDICQLGTDDKYVWAGHGNAHKKEKQNGDI